ncbi:Ig-like domain-containing protein [Fusibacter paucivorans]|uniref:Ig-like domain-containing protein n=1 Tax=Fusibacter paucivorans TaxID=76009 RepID=A0ABS5PMA9_9FIRM|nr:Ig-like domain-containing protein [Fusibacter paucivorans]MBS7526288.1 Ig-like domain-containing protein [Fusibacter paucivorans]
MKQFRSLKSISLILVCLLMLGIASFAEGGNGSGGGGGDNPLTLESVDVADGLDAVGVDEIIYLNFSNNVVNLSVKDANAACFSMVDSAGEPANFLTFFGDDQVNRDIRNTIEIRPFGGWTPGETYTLNISKDLTAKNGSALGEDAQVTFTIVADEAAAETAPEATAPEASAESGESSPETTEVSASDSNDTAASEATDADAPDESEAAEPSNDTVEDQSGGISRNTILVVVVGLIVVVGVVWVVKSK